MFSFLAGFNSLLADSIFIRELASTHPHVHRSDLFQNCAHIILSDTAHCSKCLAVQHMFVYSADGIVLIIATCIRYLISFVLQQNVWAWRSLMGGTALFCKVSEHSTDGMWTFCILWWKCDWRQEPRGLWVQVFRCEVHDSNGSGK